MVALRPRPNETVSATTLANCSPCPVAASSAPEATTGKMPGRMQASATTTERKARPMKAATKKNSMVRPRVSLLDHAGAVARRDRREAGHRQLVAGIFGAQTLQRMVDRIDDRQQLAGVDVGHPRRDDDRVLIRVDEAPRQMLGQKIDIFLQGRDVGRCRAFSLSQRRSVSSDQTLPTPG